MKNRTLELKLERAMLVNAELTKASLKLVAYMAKVGYQDDEGTQSDLELRHAIAKAMEVA